MLSQAGSLDVLPISQLCRALGDDTRVRIVALLTHGELCSCHVEQALSLSQPNASRHLAILKTAGLIEGRREGTWVYYKLAAQADPARKKLLAAIIKSFEGHDRLAKDVERLRKAKGPSSCK